MAAAGSATILIQPDVVIFRDPTKPRAHQHKWWAEGGLIHWEDQEAKDGDAKYGSQTVKDTLDRLRGLNDMIGSSRSGQGWNHPDEMQKFRSYIDQMIVVCQKARDQGMPNVKAHANQMVSEIKAKRQSRMHIAGLSTPRW